jgi:hypothetical protein
MIVSRATILEACHSGKNHWQWCTIRHKKPAPTLVTPRGRPVTQVAQQRQRHPCQGEHGGVDGDSECRDERCRGLRLCIAACRGCPNLTLQTCPGGSPDLDPASGGTTTAAPPQTVGLAPATDPTTSGGDAGVVPRGHGFVEADSGRAVAPSSTLSSKEGGMTEAMLQRTVFISHSRRDPAALNAVHAIIHSLRSETRADGTPICRAVYLKAASLWLDTEQLAEVPGSNWSAMLARVQKQSMMNCFFLCNAFCGSDECMKELECASPRCPPAPSIPLLRLVSVPLTAN